LRSPLPRTSNSVLIHEKEIGLGCYNVGCSREAGSRSPCSLWQTRTVPSAEPDTRRRRSGWRRGRESGPDDRQESIDLSLPRGSHLRVVVSPAGTQCGGRQNRCLPPQWHLVTLDAMEQFPALCLGETTFGPAAGLAEGEGFSHPERDPNRSSPILKDLARALHLVEARGLDGRRMEECPSRSGWVMASGVMVDMIPC
jgi:hypothetical protein